jgi:hypothetical protein
MIITELKGGLGNQLFQYAAGIGLSQHLHTSLKVDIRNLKSADKTLGTYRRYVLSNLLHSPQICSESEISQISTNSLSKILFSFGSSSFKAFKEKHFHYHEEFLNLKGNIYLRGNFQSEKYFEAYKKNIFSQIQFNKLLLDTNDARILNDISNAPSLAVHVRRGDYVSNKIANDVLGTLPLDYYKASYNEICKGETIVNTFIFSDDINWAKENFSFIKNIFFVQSKGDSSDIVDFYLMQHCSHNIIANSSFSWWAAYLNPNPNKIVIAPKKWFNKAPYNTKDLIPAGWLTI